MEERMKINVTIDCTPQEARRFFGQPDIEPLQQALLAKLQSQMEKNLAAMNMGDIGALMKNFLTGADAASSWSRWQEMFSKMAGGAGGKGENG